MNPNQQPQQQPPPPQPGMQPGATPPPRPQAPAQQQAPPQQQYAQQQTQYDQQQYQQQYGPPQFQQGPPQQQQPPAQMQQAQANPNSTQNTLEIAEIREGIVIMSDGSYRAIIMAQSINFDLMSPQEREGVEFSYQSFLNSLYFPIQILVRSQKVDIRPYMDKLIKLQNEQDNMLLAYLMEDYIGYIQALAQETNIMDKQFYIVIPYTPEANVEQVKQASKGIIKKFIGGGPKQQTITIHEADLEAAKGELKNRVQSVLSALLQLGVQGIPLDTQELIELYYDVYNPDTATHSGALSRTDLSAPVVRKGTGTAQNPNLDRGV